MAAGGFAVPAFASRITFASLLVAGILTAAWGQNASARRNFVSHLAQSTIVTRKGSQLAPAYRLSVAGPDSAFFVYHAQLMNPSICRSMLTERLVARFGTLGFTKLICTDDSDVTFAFAPVVQNVTAVDSRRDYVEMIRRSVIKQMGARTPAGYNLSAEGWTPQHMFIINSR